MTAETTISIAYRLLLPVARFCLKRGLVVQEITETLKQALVDAAVEDLEKDERKVSVSSISTRTGIRRREVTRIWRHQETKEVTPSVPSRVLSRWCEDERFLTKSGRPRVLSFEADRGEFVDLAQSVSKDIYPKVVLQTLINAGAVVETPYGVKLVKRVYSSSENPLEAYTMVSRDVENLMETVEENVSEAVDPVNLHNTLYFTNIREEDVPTIRNWLLDSGSAFHRKVLSYLSRFDQDLNFKKGKLGGVRVYFTSFSRVLPPTASKRDR
ncbi:MAG: hypothetical protein KDD70_08890 [Bdellovibrionales bacterium]|nr:hypothetical protein [Bdellovibrionales bacterium]